MMISVQRFRIIRKSIGKEPFRTAFAVDRIHSIESIFARISDKEKGNGIDETALNTNHGGQKVKKMSGFPALQRKNSYRTRTALVIINTLNGWLLYKLPK